MPDKTNILHELGETALLLPQVINRALAANDRVKYFITLLQAARNHAERLDGDVPALTREREASGVDDATFDAVVAGSVRDSGEFIHVPRAAEIHARILDGLAELLEPLQVAAQVDGDGTERYERYHHRLERLIALAPAIDDTRIPVRYIDAVTHGRRDGSDGLHVLVMDLHKEINRLQSQVASETIDGATVYGVSDLDRGLVAAFMAGLNSTAPLKFDHPGLGTTATRAGDRLVLQNDIGTTDNHVIVLHVTGLTITMTYTDVHPARLEFFQSLLTSVGFEWSRTGTADAHGGYEMCVGRVTSPDDAELRHRLTLIGSQLVFLIDWNRARKRLTRFVKNADATAVLKWAAEQRVGHRAFLQAGDVRLVYTAMERIAPTQVRFGARLDEILGRDSARSFLQAVLRITAEGLRDHKSPRLVQDQIHAELLTHIETSEQSVLSLASDHAAMIAAMAELVRGVLTHACRDGAPDEVARGAARAKEWETRADDVVSRARSLLRHGTGDGARVRFLGDADDVADGLEEAAFLATLLVDGRRSRSGLEALGELADLLVSGSRSYVRCVECARDASHFGTSDDLEEFLVAVDEVIAFEHESDARERRVKATLIDVASDFRALHVLSAIGGCFEDCADTLARCALTLRDSVLDARKVQ